MICRNCGAKLNDGARFCAKCGQKVENMVQGTGMSTPPNTGMNTPPNTYYGQPVNSGNYNQNKPKKKHIALIAVAIVLAGIFLLIGIVFISAISSVVLSSGDDKDAGQSEAEDPYYDDVVQSIQGDWYIWGKDKAWWHFSIEGTSYELYTQDLSTMATAQVQGRIEPIEQTSSILDDVEQACFCGELKFVDSSGTEKIIRYTYPHLVSGSTKLEWDGFRLERNDVYGRIKELIQGQWLETDEDGNNYVLRIEDTGFNLLVNLDTIYGGKVSIKGYGIINLCVGDDDIVLATLHYEYDENTDSIVLKDGENVLEKSSIPSP